MVSSIGIVMSTSSVLSRLVVINSPELAEELLAALIAGKTMVAGVQRDKKMHDLI